MSALEFTVGVMSHIVLCLASFYVYANWSDEEIWPHPGPKALIVDLVFLINLFAFSGCVYFWARTFGMPA